MAGYLGLLHQEGGHDDIVSTRAVEAGIAYGTRFERETAICLKITRIWEARLNVALFTSPNSDQRGSLTSWLSDVIDVRRSDSIGQLPGSNFVVRDPDASGYAITSISR